LEQKAFKQVVTRLRAVLEKQGFPLNQDSVCQNSEGMHAFFIGREMAYGVFYEAEKKRFILRYCSVENGQPEGKWRNRSALLFDPENEEDASRQTDSIIADFTDEVTEKDNKEAVVQRVTKHRRHRGEESKTDALFFYNRLVNVFPELREEIIQERVTYGQIRTATFAREKVLPKMHTLLQGDAQKQQLKKLAEIYSELYANGDTDVHAVITFVLLNSLSDAEVEKLEPYFTPEMKIGCQFARKMRGKKLKPEKPKKQSKNRVVATLNDMER